MSVVALQLKSKKLPKTFKASARLKEINIPRAKASYMAMPKIRGRENVVGHGKSVDINPVT